MPDLSADTGETTSIAEEEEVASPRGNGRIALALLCLFACALIALVITLMNVRHYTVQGDSMKPTLLPGDKVYYTGFSKMEYGDVVIFDAGDVYGRVIKRVAGLPGDLIEVTEDGQLLRNGTPIDEDYILPDQFGNSGLPEVTVAEGKIFVLGDNRAESIDSRDIRVGQIDRRAVIGVVTRLVRVLNTGDRKP